MFAKRKRDKNIMENKTKADMGSLWREMAQEQESSKNGSYFPSCYFFF